MFLAGWWVGGWWEGEFAVKAALVVWLAYALIDIIVGSGADNQIAVLFAVSFLTKLGAVYPGRIGRRSSRSTGRIALTGAAKALVSRAPSSCRRPRQLIWNVGSSLINRKHTNGIPLHTFRHKRLTIFWKTPSPQWWWTTHWSVCADCRRGIPSRRTTPFAFNLGNGRWTHWDSLGYRFSVRLGIRCWSGTVASILERAQSSSGGKV